MAFELSPPAVGKTAWTRRVLHRFKMTSEARPEAGLIADGAGNLYGTTASGQAHDDGVAFKLTP